MLDNLFFRCYYVGQRGVFMENLLIAINCVLPVFIIICTGALMHRSNIVPEATFKHISTLAFHYLLPCMLFHSIYTTDLSNVFDPRLLGFQVAFLMVWFAVGFILCTIFIPDHRTRGAFIQTFYRSNIAIVGVSMADSMMGASGVASIAVSTAVLVPIYNVLAVITLEVCRGGKIELRPTLVGIAKNPLIFGCLSGVAFLLLGIELPGSVLKAVSQIGTAGSVMTLVSLGASFTLSGVRKNLKKLLAANALRLIVTPLVAIVCAVAFGLEGNDLGIVLLCTATSLATTSFPMAIARDSDHELTGQIVVTTSFLCCITLFFWIFILKQIGLL